MATLKWFLLLVLLVTIRYGMSQSFGTLPLRPTTGVRLYLGYESRVIPNYFMVKASQFYDVDQTNDGDRQNDGIWCQSALNESMIGIWYSPNGSPVPTEDFNNKPLHSYNTDVGQVGLLRDAGIGSVQGLYFCIIPNEEGINQTLYIAAYGDNAFDNSGGPVVDRNKGLEFSLLSTRDTNPPVFTLYFNVTNTPPTTVTCSVNGNTFNIAEGDLNRVPEMTADPIRVGVIVTIRRREAGEYSCIIRTNSSIRSFPTATTPGINISVTNSPTDLNYTRTGLTSVLLTWLPPIINTPAVIGYEVFYDLSNGTRVSMETNTAELTLTSLQPDVNYTAFVVAYGGDLPSEHSNIIVISQVISAEVTGPNTPLLYGSNFSLRCNASISAELNEVMVQVIWADQYLQVINMTTGDISVGSGLDTNMLTDTNTYSLDLNFNNLQATQVGIYTCGSAFIERDSEPFILRRQISVSVQVPDPTVSTLVTPNSELNNRNFESGMISLGCLVIITSLDVDTNVSITWFGPNGVVVHDNTRYSIDTGQLNTTVYGSSLNISDLSLTGDNGTQYYCRAQVGVNDSFVFSPFVIPSEATSQNVTVIVEAVPSPSVESVPLGLPIVDRTFTLTCNAVVPDNVIGLATISSVTWLYNGSETLGDNVTPTYNGSNSANLTFSPVSQTQEGLYTCVAILNIPSIPLQRNATVDYDFRTLGDPVVSITTSGSSIAGNMYSLLCSVSVVTGIPNITWFDSNGIIEMNDTGITLTFTMMSNTLYISELQFNPLNYSHIGEYTCKANLTVVRSDFTFDGFNSYKTTVYVKIPTPTVSITPGSLLNVTRATQQDLSCNVSLSDPIPPTPNVTINLEKNGQPIDLSNSRISKTLTNNSNVYSTILTFTPIDNDDAGNYTCTGNVSPIGSGFNIEVEPFIIGSSNSALTELIVQAIPVPDITVIAIGTDVAGESYSVVCSVDVDDNLYNIVVNTAIVSVVVGSSMTFGDNNVSISYTPLITSHSGQYQCIVNISQNDISYQVSYVETFTINTTIPQPAVTVSTHPVDPNSLIEATHLDIVCTVNISDAVNTGVSVDVKWSHNGGSPLTNNSDYTISSLTMLGSHMYTSTLRIESLSNTRDNGAMYSCTVSVLPSPVSPYITGNENNNNITLNVADFTADHVIVDILFPTTPTAGDQFTMTCNISIPERLVHDITRLAVIWSYDLAREQRVEVINSNTIIGNVTKIGNLILNNLTINPVKTSDGRRYYCSVIFNDLGVNDHVLRDLNVQIPPPSMVITHSPSTGPIYESTNFNLTCTGTLPSVVDTTVSATVVWFDPLNKVIPVETRRMITNVTSNGNNEFESTLVFLPIDNGDHNSNFNDTGTYTCKMTISSSDPLIISGINNTTDTITVQTLPDMQINISTVGSTEVGQNLNITCTVRVVERLVVMPTIEIMKMNTTILSLLQDTNISYTITTDDTGSETNWTIILEPVMFEDRGVYICKADFNVTGVNGTDDPSTATYDVQFAEVDYELIVDFPPVSPSISQSHHGVLYAGTQFFLRCVIILNDLVTIPVIVRNQWTRNGTSVPNGLSNDTTITDGLIQNGSLQYEATLHFNPLDNTDDSGQYSCNFNILPNISDSEYVRNSSANNSTTITVQALPSPIMNIITTGIARPGEEYNITCTVEVIDRLIVTPIIIWIKDSVNTSLVSDDLKSISVPSLLINISDTMYSLSLFFSSLNTSDAGQYTCQATIIVNEINVTVTNTSVQDLPLQIPTPDLDISLSRQNDYLAGSELNITCDITIDPHVNTPFIVNTVWEMLDEVSSGIGMQVTDPEILKDDSGSGQSRISLINPARIAFNTYRSQVQFSTLSSSMDSGMYTCTVDVMPMVGYNYINAASTTNITTNFTVEDPVIGDFAAMPDSFLGLETSCSDSDPYDNFTLVCTASKPALVIPALEVIWLHNGTERQRVTTQNDDTYVTNTLSFLTSFANDSGTYTCTAKLTIPESPDISSTENSTAILRFQRNPHVAIDISSTVGQTTSTIYFTIPSIAYTPEIYHINYIGLELQNTLTTSSSLVGTDNITAVNLMYQITLTGLEEANTYNFTVVSTNCIGNTSSETMNFTTLPSLPIAPPRNLTNTTFLPRSVTLDWDPPVRIDQNGEVVGYNLTCIQNNDGSEVSGLTATQSSPVTIFTIPVLLPFTEYTCNLSFINVVGEGPAAQHPFKTAQDRPSDAPQNFTSTSTKTDVTFNWRRPSTPNGIIRQYNLTVINLVTNQINNTIIYASSNQETVSMTINGFSPYQNYTATVTASTVVGYGPSAITEGRTDPDITSEPLLVIRPVIIGGMFINNTIPVVNDTAVNLTWSPPTTPNGFISRYLINVTGGVTLNQVVTAVPQLTTYTHIIGRLRPGVPYYITVVAVNELGEGNAISITVFTKYLTPLIVPGNIETTRSSDGTAITISWNPVTLEQARGFFQYQIILQPQNNRRRQTSDIITYVPYNQTSITVPVDAQLVYSVTVGVSVQNETGGFISGPTNPPITIDSPITTQPPDNTTLIGIIVGVILGVIIAIIIIVVIIVCCVLYKRRYKGGITFGGSRNKQRDLFELVESPIVSAGVTNNFSILNDAPDIMNGSAETKPLSPDEKKIKEIEDEFKENQEDEGHLDEDMVLERMKPIAVASFHEHVQRMHIDSDKGFESEYKSVPMQTDTPFNDSTTEANKPKNRFANIFPYDFSRVKLQNPQGTPDGDYINACFIDGYMRKECYIAAQGPLPTTVGDFWRMIWEQRVNHIVMLTGVIEGGKKKCEQYWPDKVGETLEVQSGFVVLLNSFVPFADYIIRDFKVTKSDDPEARPLIVSHYHFTSWPDHGVPQFATSLIAFIKRVQKDHDKDKGIPLLVHCSAGVGRTGTFIMLDSMIDRLKLEDSINVYEFLRQMRSKRMFMVQTLAQYVFIHDAMDELTTCGETGILASNLRARVNKMHKIVPGKNVTGFQEQFELLEQVGYKPSESACSDGTESVNMSKNRYPDILPLNMHRPRLRPDGSAGSDYINASYIDGYKQRNAYIVTQGPLKNTVEEFWRMIMEFKNRCIVQLCNNVEEGMEKCYMYWPTKEGEPVEYGRMKVTLQSETPSGDYIIRKLLVCNERGGKSEREGQVITQFHCTTWPEHGHPTSTGSIIELIDMLTRAQMNSGNKAIAIVCNDGVGRSGAFICIHSQLERLKTEGEVDIFKYLKTARTRRIGLLSELDHYVFCHEVLADYVEAFDPYANFKDMS